MIQSARLDAEHTDTRPPHPRACAVCGSCQPCPCLQGELVAVSSPRDTRDSSRRGSGEAPPGPAGKQSGDLPPKKSTQTPSWGPIDLGDLWSVLPWGPTWRLTRGPGGLPAGGLQSEDGGEGTDTSCLLLRRPLAGGHLPRRGPRQPGVGLGNVWAMPEHPTAWLGSPVALGLAVAGPLHPLRVGQWWVCSQPLGITAPLGAPWLATTHHSRLRLHPLHLLLFVRPAPHQPG